MCLQGDSHWDWASFWIWRKNLLCKEFSWFQITTQISVLGNTSLRYTPATNLYFSAVILKLFYEVLIVYYGHHLQGFFLYISLPTLCWLLRRLDKVFLKWGCWPACGGVKPQATLGAAWPHCATSADLEANPFLIWTDSSGCYCFWSSLIGQISYCL